MGNDALLRVGDRLGRVIAVLAIAHASCGTACRRTSMRTTDPRVTIWKIDESRKDGSSVIRFHFPPPQDVYAGEVGRVRGELYLGDDFLLDRSGGWFSVDVMDVTLGEPDLDENVRNNVELLSGKRFPTSTFRVRSITADQGRIVPGRRAEVTLHGDFELKGVTIPLSVSASLEFAIDSNDRSALWMSGSFALEALRKTFDIMGPGGGDDVAGDRLHFAFRFTLVRRTDGDSSLLPMPPE